MTDLGKDCSQYATILNNMAGTYRLTGNHVKAISLFHEAAEVYRQSGMEDSYAYASVLNNLALAYRENGQNEQAITCMRSQ